MLGSAFALTYLIKTLIRKLNYDFSFHGSTNIVKCYFSSEVFVINRTSVCGLITFAINTNYPAGNTVS